MGYKSSVNVMATAVETDNTVDLSICNLRLFSYGAFSNVYKGDMSGGEGPQTVVIKKTWSAKDKKSLTEVSILKVLNRLRHKNIVRLLYTYKTNYAENANICHRDIKPQNLLVDGDSGILKISDFGSSSINTTGTLQPSYHVTRYYRPPELLLGSKLYGPELDVWSGGCVMGEMLKGATLFLGHSTDQQFELIADTFGHPSQEELVAMNVSKSKWRDMLNIITKRKEGAGLSSLFRTNHTYCDVSSIELLQRVLLYDPHKRLHGHEFLTDSWFDELFKPDAKRPNGANINCLSSRDLSEVRIGDSSMTGTV